MDEKSGPNINSETRYEVYYLMPGWKLSPPQELSEWWKKYFEGGVDHVFSRAEAIDHAAEIEHVDNFRTKIVEVTITRKEI